MSNEMTPSDREQKIKEIKEREKNATKGPWEKGVKSVPTLGADMSVPTVKASRNGRNVSIEEQNVTFRTYHLSEQNAKFVAHARQDIPFLLSELERLEAVNAEFFKNVLEEINGVESMATTKITTLQKELEFRRAENKSLHEQYDKLETEIETWKSRSEINGKKAFELQDENADLRDECERFKSKYVDSCMRYEENFLLATKSLTDLQSRLDKAVAALEKYSKECLTSYCQCSNCDDGRCGREVLAEIKGDG